MKKAISVAALLAVALLVALAWAANDHEKVLSADGGGSITSGLNFLSAPSIIDVAANGTATIKFMWFFDNATDRAESSLAVIGPTWVLRDWTGPRSFTFAGGPDSFYVDAGTADDVIVSW